ncbi:hypothetical protein KP509_16G055700 [Ceratopteris richardii]|uniref:Uncharacterized protein n=1 Tax=Ceratopteris richardii TaxID=49495 RepID=A0A8T2T2N4_CERRI|nr:hypothetical protein KP509_16G055700 [Ceratopteris richardii]KAH7388065.1 hypothetical protein KP509_16G055700 [Ceratopteris richardii]KAH7388066.1 hypothetical protein KP509_16G055700 [Ceratopteris richardii]KAH7388067.1 hypothetical protein KP509_16G055700 [Ceratopteris richardii]
MSLEVSSPSSDTLKSSKLPDLGVAAGINLLSAFIFLVAFAVLRFQPVNDRVYYPKWYNKGVRTSKTARRSLSSIVNLNWRVYLHFLNWTREALHMPESELIEHAGLDSAIFLRAYILGLKIFVPLMIMGCLVLIPINATGGSIKSQKFGEVDIGLLAISNVFDKSRRLWAHVVMIYVFTAWVCGMLYIEYKNVMLMRLNFHDAVDRRPEQYTVLVKNIPSDPDEPLTLHVEHFFRVNHPDYYLSHQMVRNANKLAKLLKRLESLENWKIYYKNKQEREPGTQPRTKTGFLGLWGEHVDAVQWYTSAVEQLRREILKERERVMDDPKAVLPVAFVSFKGRWGAAVAAQTQQTKNPTIWLTEWAPEPSDVYWPNLAIPFVELTIRKLLMRIVLFFLVFFFIIPVTFVQSLASLDQISEKLPFLKPIVNTAFISSLIQGYLPGLALKLFLAFLPRILMLMSKIEGYTSLSSLERTAAAKYFIFLVVTVFFGSIFTGAAYTQLNAIIKEPPTKLPTLIGNGVGYKALFFITFIMIDGWAGIAAEILRLKPLIIYHLKNTFLVKTEKDRDKAMDPGSIGLNENLPQIEFYFLVGLVYSVIAPVLIPFIVVFFAFAYLVYRHQIINVYVQEYESAGAFWPHLHGRVIACVILQQICVFGILLSKKATKASPMLILLPVFTITFHLYCKNRFEPAFRKYPLEEAMAKDTRERAMEPNFSVKNYLQATYLPPALQIEEEDEENVISREDKWSEGPPLVPTKRSSRANTPAPSVTSETPMMRETIL